MFKDAWVPAYFSQVVILVNAKVHCFLRVFLWGRDNKCCVGEGRPRKLGHLERWPSGWEEDEVSGKCRPSHFIKASVVSVQQNPIFNEKFQFSRWDLVRELFFACDFLPASQIARGRWQMHVLKKKKKITFFLYRKRKYRTNHALGCAAVWMSVSPPLFICWDPKVQSNGGEVGPLGGA